MKNQSKNIFCKRERERGKNILTFLQVKLRLLICIALVPVFILLVYSTVERRKIKIEETKRECLAVSKNVAAYFEEIVEGSRYFLVSLSHILEEQLLDQAAVSRLFVDIKEHLPLYANVFALKPNGDIFASVVGLTKAVNSADLPYFSQVVRNRKFSFGDYQLGRIVGKPVIVAAYPAFYKDGQLLAVAACSLDLEKINSQLQQMMASQKGVLTIVDRHGTILARYPDPEKKWMGKSFPGRDIAKTVMEYGAGIREVKDSAGIKWIYSLLPVESSGGKIFVNFAISKKDAFREIDREFFFSLILLSLISIFSFSAAIFIGRLAEKEGEARRESDAHSRKLEEELARASEREYSALFESLPQKVFLKNRNSIFLSCNTNYARDLGIKPEEILGKTDYDFFPTLLAEKYRDGDKRVMETGKTENIEEEYLVINDFLGGEQKSIINTVKFPVRDKSGKIMGVFGLFWDITERKKAERKLYESQQMFESIVNGITDSVLLLSIDFKVLWGNKSSIKAYGLTTEAMLGKHCYNVIHKQDRRCQSADRECPVGDILRTGVSKTLIHKHINKNGEPFFVEVTVFPIKDEDGEIVQFLHVERDITERKKAEDESRRLEQLEALTQVRMHFTSMVSHELRSPLGAIKEGISLVLEGLIGEVNDRQKDLLDTAKRNVDRLGRLINNVLDFQKIDSGKVKFNISQNDIKETASEAVNTIGVLATEKGLNIKLAAASDIPKLEFDRDRIIQVLVNLVGNAIKYTARGEINISIKKEDDFVHVMVEDTGPGIKAEDIPKLFMAFEQIDAGKGKQKGGSGLGLAISKEIILAHNGKIWVESEIDKGSVFHFTLPLEKSGG